MRCPICGADHASCGGGPGVVRAIDSLVAITEVRTVGDLKHYQDKEGHVFSMTEERAKFFGYTLVEDEPKAAAAQGRNRVAAEDPHEEPATEAQPEETKAQAAAANKARTAGANKGR